MFFKNICWLFVKKILAGRVLDQEFVASCYLRHSAALGPQNPFLSDYDLAVFVKAENTEELRERRGKVFDRISSNIITRYLCRDLLVLPDTEKAHALCSSYYSFRAVYPVESWMPIKQSLPSEKAETDLSFPLDCSVENPLFFYMLKVLKGRTRKRIFEPFFLARCVDRDHILAGQEPIKASRLSFYKALLMEVAIWSRFYEERNLRNREKALKVTVKEFKGYDFTPYVAEMNFMKEYSKIAKVVDSMWIYPAYRDDKTPNFVINLKKEISVGECKRTLTDILEMLEGMDYHLIVGREESMVGRINELSRSCLIDPWLFKCFGVCIFGDNEVRNRIVEPDMESLKRKFKQIGFRFISEIMYNKYNYNYYKICFICHHLFSHNELVLSEEDLSQLYGTDFLSRQDFDPQKDTPRLLKHLEDLHGLSLF